MEKPTARYTLLSRLEAMGLVAVAVQFFDF
jgi:hypothetical protein